MTAPTLTGKRILVAGGTGEVGEGIVRQLLLAGANVVVPARSEVKLSLLRSTHVSRRLESFLAGFSTVAEAESTVQLAAANGSIDAAVAAIGGWWQGQAMHQVSQEDWDRLIADNLTPHFAVARAVLPHLRTNRGSSYVQLLGGAATFAIPQAGLVSVTAAAVAMIGRVLDAEQQRGGVQIRQIQVNGAISTRSRPSGPGIVASSDEVGAAIVSLLDRSASTQGIGPMFIPRLRS